VRKKTRVGHQRFEGSRPNGTFSKITHEMMDSPAWKDLNLRQRGLYLAFKAKYRQKAANNKVESSNRDDISFPKAEGMTLYGDYRTFQKDLKALEDHGFIRLVQSGYRLRVCNIYALEDGWLEWKRSGEPRPPKRIPRTPAMPPVVPDGRDGRLYKGGGQAHHENSKAAN